MDSYKLYNKGEPIKRFSEFRKAYDFFHKKRDTYVFRGENYHENCGNNINEALKRSLDKAFERFKVPASDRYDIEGDMYRSFRRRAQIYCGDKSMDMLEAVALLRHYEGPARMVDWTYSLFVALCWAVSEAKCGENLALWALNYAWLGKENRNFENRCGKTKKYKKINKEEDPAGKSSIGFEYLRTKRKSSFIYAVNPYYLNERLSIQQGVLLVQGDIEKSWGDNLKEMIKNHKGKKYAPLLWRINIELDIGGLRDVLSRLRDMNISLATLYPDISGFAQSLNTYRRFL